MTTKSTKRHHKNSHKGKSTQGVSTKFSPSRSLSEIVPDKFRTTLTYVDQFVLNSTTTSTDNYVFRANSLFDPNYTGSGHQPLGYDQWTTFYNNWVVTKCSVKLTMTPPNLSTGTPQINNQLVAIVPRRNDPTAISDVMTALEQPYTRWAMVVGYAKPPTLSMTIDCPKFFGVSRNVYSSSIEYSGAIGGNPTQTLYIVICAGSTAQSINNPDPVYVTAEFLFETTFYGAITLASS